MVGPELANAQTEPHVLGRLKRRKWASSKDKRYQPHNPLLRTPPLLFSHSSAQTFEVDTLESSAWILVQAPALTRSVNWTKGPTTQLLYLQHGDNNRACVTELFERLEITYKALSSVPRTQKVSSNINSQSPLILPLLLQGFSPKMPSPFSPLSPNFPYLSKPSLKSAPFKNPPLTTLAPPSHLSPPLDEFRRVAAKSRSPLASPWSLQGRRRLLL